MPGPTNIGLINQFAYSNTDMKQSDIAHRVGVSRETVNRVLRRRVARNLDTDKSTGRPSVTTA